MPKLPWIHENKDLFHHGLSSWKRKAELSDPNIFYEKNERCIFFTRAHTDQPCWTLYSLRDLFIWNAELIGFVSRSSKDPVEDLEKAIIDVPKAEAVKYDLIKLAITERIPHDHPLAWCGQKSQIFCTTTDTIHKTIDQKINENLKMRCGNGILFDESTNKIHPASNGISFNIPTCAHEKIKILSS